LRVDGLCSPRKATQPGASKPWQAFDPPLRLRTTPLRVVGLHTQLGAATSLCRDDQSLTCRINHSLNALLGQLAIKVSASHVYVCLMETISF